jgi:hypothetical protein
MFVSILARLVNDSGTLPYRCQLFNGTVSYLMQEVFVMKPKCDFPNYLASSFPRYLAHDLHNKETEEYQRPGFAARDPESEAAQEKISGPCQYLLLRRAIRQQARNFNCSDHR